MADFRESVFWPFLSETDLSKANLEGLDTKGGEATRCKFRGANLGTKGWRRLNDCDFDQCRCARGELPSGQFRP